MLSHIWVDVERMEIVKSATQLIDNDWQGFQKKLRWMDDPAADDFEPDGNPARNIEIVKICDPNGNVDDPDEWVPVHIIKSMKSRGGGGSVNGQGTMDRFQTGLDNDDPSVTTRIFEVRKIPHYDTNIDDAADNAFTSDPSLTMFVVPGDEYEKDLRTKDDSQFVEHEILTYLKHRTNETSKIASSGVNRGRQTKLLNQYLIDESDAPDDNAALGMSGINPPYRLDPYQNIINVKLKTFYLVVIVTGGNNNFNLFASADSPGPITVNSSSTSNGVKLLDSVDIPGGNGSASGFSSCFTFVESAGLEIAWRQSRGLLPPDFNDGVSLFGSEFPSVNGSCGAPELPLGFAVASVSFSSTTQVAKAYLYSVPVGNNLVSVSITGVTRNDPGHPDPADGPTSSSGNATVTAAVYSTVKKKIKKLSDIIDFGSGSQKPTEDDTSVLGITHDNAGDYLINVNLEKNKFKTQIDNYGNKFLPYKVTITPKSNSVDSIPSQPPPKLKP